MPPLASVSIPARSPTPAHSSHSSKGKAPLRPMHQPRLYDDAPLPIGPSQDAPRDCRITQRFLDSRTCQVTYRLKVGDLEIGEVSVDEILDFVSALHLESFENRQFEEEQEAEEVAAEFDRQELEVKEIRRKERSKTKGTVVYEELDDWEGNEKGDTAQTIKEREGAAARAGRSRPTYRHLYKEPKERRRRKRDPITGELLPLSPRPEDGLEKKKRRRRKRHPITNELMPYGWTYNPDEEASGNAQSEVSDIRELSLEDRQTKRRRLESTTPSVKRSRSPIVALPSSGQPKASARDIIEIESSASESEESEGENANAKGTQPLRRSVGGMLAGKTGPTDDKSSLERDVGPSSQQSRNTMTSILHPIPQQIDESSESEEDELSSNPLQAFKNAATTENRPTPRPSSQLSQPGHRTSIAHPVASTAKNDQAITINDSSSNISGDENVDDDSEDLGEGEFNVEAILAHHLSDPRTHPKELGKKPVMLYHVKWEGWEEPTWEPASSFVDPEVVGEYERAVGLYK